MAITSSEITTDSFEVSPGLLNLICKDHFGGSASEDADEVLTRQCPYLGHSIHGESVGAGGFDGFK
jgi:hypothetical protein